MIYNTNTKVKQEHFPKFVKLIEAQFNHGGDKYKSNGGEEEFTDLICRAFPGESGVDWIMGTCMKYLGRYKNFGREKDLLKVATYMYIAWVKGGYHMAETHDDDTNRDGTATAKVIEKE